MERKKAKKEMVIERKARLLRSLNSAWEDYMDTKRCLQEDEDVSPDSYEIRMDEAWKEYCHEEEYVNGELLCYHTGMNPDLWERCHYSKRTGKFLRDLFPDCEVDLEF